ncbi:hypothetical protein D9611_010656 [Ephemerocybe angulata]|uniref:Reverse transcriptase domain-containing protein n=1 Tax=Ephemerocybe angulata TaxID=980116 RepID=A0A8H5BVK2_9AGAR|nr:hypothetical protein D9611_010656 [Tulosesus angulatus]
MYTKSHRDSTRANAEGKPGKATANMVAIITTVLNDVVRHGVSDGTDFAEGWLCPLYKKNDRADIANYRPITVLNSDYKILTKILTDRLSTMASKLIHPDQAGFIKGRSIFDQTELIRLVMSPGNEKKGAIVCLDQEKAYDKINHDFLWATLKKFGCPDTFINTIKHLYENTETSIIMNGVIGRKYSITRGVRQGDPLSCLLFDLAIESLASQLRQSKLKGLQYEGVEERMILSNLFADDTTVFLSEDDDFGVLLKILDRWCQASGAKFNINKTTVIPLGNEIHRHRLRKKRRLQKGSTRLPLDIHIAQDGEPVRILGAYFGHGISEDEVWQPIMGKIKTTLGHWAKNRPTIRGLAMSHNTLVGGFTQYLTRVQGMPKDTVDKLKGVTDDYIWAKDGEKKANTIGMPTLQRPKNEGGLGLLNIETRNEAIDAKRIQTLTLPPNKQPTWCKLAARQLAKAAVKKYTNVGEAALVSPFLQTWRVNLSAKDLPENLRQMMRVAYKYNTKLITINPSTETKRQMPLWYHIGNKDKLVSIYGDCWGICQRENHAIIRVGEMVDHTDNLNTPGCSQRKNCKCPNCKSDRLKGCENPTKCRRNGLKKLGNLIPEWDPRIPGNEEARAASQGEPREDGEFTPILNPIPDPSHPLDLIRMFTDPDEAPKGILHTDRFGPAPQVPSIEEHVEAYAIH